MVDERCSPDEVVIICPEPGCGDQSGNRSFSLKTNLTNCWRCGKTTTSSRVAVFWLRQHGIEVSAEDLQAEPLLGAADLLAQELDAAPAPDNHQVSLPAGFTALTADPSSVYAELISAMARTKRLELVDFERAGVGFTKVGPWEPFAIFPVLELNRVVYYQGRTYSASTEGQKTKKFPSKHEVPFGASHWVYGFNEMMSPGAKVIVIVESILNVLSLRRELANRGMAGFVPVAVFKHAISQPQLNKILASAAPEFCLLFDDDAMDSAWKEAQVLSGSRLTSVVRMPSKVDANDDAQLAVDLLLKREAYSPVNALSNLTIDL